MKRSLPLCVIAAGCLYHALPAKVLAGDLALFPFASEEGMKAVSATGANVTLSSRGSVPVLRVTTGHTESWPGFTLRAPEGKWDLSPYAQVIVRVRNIDTNMLAVSCRVDNEGADGTRNCLTGSRKIEPGAEENIIVPLRWYSDDKMLGKLFGMRGYPVSAGGDGTIDPGRINQILVFLTKPSRDHVFEVTSIKAAGVRTKPTAWASDASPFFPFIDTFGQYRHKIWPGKAVSQEDLAARREAEAQELKANPGPSDWDKFGGWSTGPALKATGFFRTEKVRGKWWLVDPEGHLFFSHGIDCVRMLDITPIDERDSWFEGFPGTLPDFAQFNSTGYALKGHYAGKTPKCFSFAAANLKRKYGPEWKQACPEVIHHRLRSWGLNTIANWSDLEIGLMRRTPYTDTIGSGRTRNLEGSEGYWGKFPDVFDASFTNSLRRAMEGKTGKSAGDPWCIGYFSDNEMSWGDELSLAVAALESPPDQAAKRAFIADLKTKYTEIEKLNQAWGTAHASWDGLLEDRKGPDVQKAREDLGAFYTQVAERYFRLVREAIREKAPQQLYLGCRFAWVNSRAAKAAAKFCDVVSYNLYQRGVADFRFNGQADVPLIIGEFHFGALDRGMFHTGLVPVESQAARAQAYKDYVLGALRHPQFVGCHWFQYQDEPVTGRVYDEENYQIGFVDVADTPYAETIAASREVARQLYSPK